MATESFEHLAPHRRRVLITVKAYPLPSRSYTELVCTAGIQEDGSWIRIYPVPFRFIKDDIKYKKYQWMDLDLVKNTSDFRPESFRPVPPNLSTASVVSHVGTKNYWHERRKWCCREVYYSMTRLIEDSRRPHLKSLATFKPTRLLDLKVAPVDRDWKNEWIELRKQTDLFSEMEIRGVAPIPKLPYKFSYYFEDVDGRKSTLMIEDWEIGALYWNCLRRANGNEEEAVEKVRAKYFESFQNKDLYLFLGTTQRYHGFAPNPFVIIGVFYPPVEPGDPQYNLF